MKKLLYILLFVPLFGIGQDFIIDEGYSNKKYAEFDGVNEGIQAGSATSSYGSSATFALWFRATDELGSNYRSLISEYIYSVAGMRAFIEKDYNRLRVQICSSSNASIYSPTQSNMRDGNWHFAAWTITAAGCIFYYDGVQFARTTAYAYLDVTARFQVGFGVGYFQGGLDEVSSFSGELTKEQLDYLYLGKEGTGDGTPSTGGDAREISSLRNFFNFENITAFPVIPNESIGLDATANYMVEETDIIDNGSTTPILFLTTADGDVLITE